MAESYHIPVLLQQSVDALSVKEDGVYADLTFGGGGHSAEILKRLDSNGRLLAFDQDKDTIANIPDDSRIIFCQSNFKYLLNFARYYKAMPLDGILADLGVSSHHFDESERGFSFRYDGPLDMRMNQNASLTADYIINNYSEDRLSNIFHLYGEVRAARKIASEIIKKRGEERIDTIFKFAKIVDKFCGYDKKKELAKIFQALRIEVNDELGALKTMLVSSEKALRRGGKLVIITYHSLEDRLVKNYMKSGNFEGEVKQDFYGNITAPFKQTEKMITPSEDEMERNPRSRSAKLRVAEKV